MSVTLSIRSELKREKRKEILARIAGTASPRVLLLPKLENNECMDDDVLESHLSTDWRKPWESASL